MKILMIICSLCLLTSPIICKEDAATGRSYDDGESRDGYSGYGGGGYGGGTYGYGGGATYYNNPPPVKHVAFDLGLPLVVGGLGLGLGVGALKGLVLGALLGKKKYNLFHSFHQGCPGCAYGGGYGASNYGNNYGNHGYGIGNGYGIYGNY